MPYRPLTASLGSNAPGLIPDPVDPIGMANSGSAQAACGMSGVGPPGDGRILKGTHPAVDGGLIRLHAPLREHLLRKGGRDRRIETDGERPSVMSSETSAPTQSRRAPSARIPISVAACT